MKQIRKSQPAKVFTVPPPEVAKALEAFRSQFGFANVSETNIQPDSCTLHVFANGNSVIFIDMKKEDGEWKLGCPQVGMRAFAACRQAGLPQSPLLDLSLKEKRTR